MNPQIYNRFDRQHDVPADPYAGIICGLWLLAWGFIAGIALVETFTDWLG